MRPMGRHCFRKTLLACCLLLVAGEAYAPAETPKEARQIDRLLARLQAGGEGRAKVVRDLASYPEPRVKTTLLNVLGDNDSNVRFEAREVLKLFGDTDVAPRLRKMLESTAPMVRADAAELLGYLGDETSAPTLLAMAVNPNEDAFVRAMATGALGELRYVKAVGPLVGLAADPNLAMILQRHAFVALERIGTAQAVRTLESVAQGKNLQARYEALGALARLTRTSSYDGAKIFRAALAEKDRVLPRVALEGLDAGLSAADEGALTTAATHTDGDVAGFALYLLARRNVKKALPTLTTLLADTKNGGRDRALRALTMLVTLARETEAWALQSGRTTRELRENLAALRDAKLIAALVEPYGTAEDKADTLGIVGMIGGKDAVDALLKLAAETKNANEALTALGYTKDKRSLDYLKKVLADNADPLTGDAYKAAIAAAALAEMADPMAATYLLGYFKDARIGISACAYGLGRMKDVGSVKTLMARLNEREIHIRDQVYIVRALGQIGDVRAFATLLGVLEGNHSKVGESQELIYLLQSEAAEAIGRLGRASAVNLLKRLATKKSVPRAVRYGAVRGLGHLKNAKGIPALLAALADVDDDVREAAAAALAEFGPKAPLEEIRKRLASDDWRVRSGAAIALGHCRASEAVDDLAKVLASDERWIVRRAAAHALGRIGTKAAVKVLTPAAEPGQQQWRVRSGAYEALLRISTGIDEKAKADSPASGAK